MTTQTTFIHTQIFTRDCVRQPRFHRHICKLLKDLSFDPSADNVVFYFQPTPDLFELSKLFVSVRCGKTTPYFKAASQYDIDLNTLQISDPDHVAVPRDISSVAATDAAMELRKYANNLLKKVQKYRDQLIQHGIIADSSPFLQVDLLTCPLCHGHLESCSDCNLVVACPSHTCPASAATEGLWCTNTTILSCRECLDTKGLDAAVVQCPTCQLWRYGPCMHCCFGLIVRSPGEPGSQPESDHESAVERSHPWKLGPCNHCIEAGLAPKWKYCYGYPCPSRPQSSRHFIGAFCPDCSAVIKGRGCVCGLLWICDVCEDGRSTFPHATCPRCGRTYCLEPGRCNYCQICSTCKKSRLCNDCIEEEPTPGEDQAPVITFVERCEQCNGMICDACSPRTLKCHFCKTRVCGRCTEPSHCSDCKMPICVTCDEYQWDLAREDSDVLIPCPPRPGHGEEQDSGLMNKDNDVLMMG